MIATLEKIGGFTREAAIHVVNSNSDIVVIAKRKKNFEIIDSRPLGVRLENPIKSKDVVSWFGLTHFVVTEKFLDALKETWKVDLSFVA